jgi:hypothetical protein
MVLDHLEQRVWPTKNKQRPPTTKRKYVQTPCIESKQKHLPTS